MKNILFDKPYMVPLERVNELAESDPLRLVSICEEYYNSQLCEVCEKILSGNVKIVLIAGPSGSGKTTTARKISEKIISKGRRAVYISLDDFFLNRDVLPILKNGDTDFESVNTLDIAEIRKCFSLLLSGNETAVPYFDFVEGKRDADKARRIAAAEDEVIIVEGLHALNPKLTDGIEAINAKASKGFFRLFVNPRGQVVDESGEPLLHKKSLRLMRRMIRDYKFRGSSVANTMKMWNGVCREEAKSILPFSETADYYLDTAHFYEPCVYHNYLLPIFADSVTEGDAERDIVDKLSKRLELFYDIPMSVIPEDSMIREFVGAE